jgi:hypothetical protein
MKKVYLLLLFVFGFSAFAQQKGISYQAVIINPNAVAAPGYNGTSIPLANKAICLSFKIVNSANQVEYQESQAITTDGYGMVNVVIGTGTSGAGLVSTMEAIAWNQGNKKLVVGVNTEGVCSNYTEISNQVLNYTPYSFYAQNADIKDGYVTTAKLADGAVTDPKVAMGINPSKVGLGNVNNTSDANKPVSTATQTALNLKANAADVTTSLSLKEDISNKSNASLGTSTTLYPTQNAVKTYVDSQISSATIVDANATTKGKIKLAGDLAGTADLPTVPGLALKADTSSLSTVATSGNYNDLTNKPSIPFSFALPVATASVLGGVKVGANLSIDANGVLNAAGGNNASTLTGVVSIANGGTSTTSVSGIKSMLGLNTSKIAIGDQAGQTGQQNYTIALGAGAGASNQISGAIAIGGAAGGANQGSSSVAIGSNAGQANQSQRSVAVGFAAGQNNQGENAVAIGTFAGNNGQIANSIAINATGMSTPLNPTNAGFYVNPIRNASASNSLFYDPTTKEITYGSGSSGQTYVDLTSTQRITGAKAFSADLNVYGITVGRGNSGLSYNTVVGLAALNSNTTGNYNNAFGSQALAANLDGYFNSAFGQTALFKNTSGYDNSAYGFNALNGNTTGSNNSAMGSNSLVNSTTGSGNTAIGMTALSANTTGSNNTGVGFQANVAANNLTNATAIGYGAAVTASNTIQLGNTSVTDVKTSGTLTLKDVTYPNTNGTAGQVLTANNNGNASWTTVAGTLPTTVNTSANYNIVMATGSNAALVTGTGNGGNAATLNPYTGQMSVSGLTAQGYGITSPIYASTPQTLTDATTIAWNPLNGLNANVTLGGNRTLNFSGSLIAGSYGTLVVTQDVTGGRTLTLPSVNNKVLGSSSTTTIALSTAAGAKDIVNFYYDGTNYFWNVGQGYGTAATSSTTNLATGVTGTLAVANGGTGATTLTGYVKGTGTTAMTANATIPVADVSGAAPLASPTFTGIPEAPTAATGTNTTQVATTAFVAAAVAASGGGSGTHTIGEVYGGGKIFYVTPNGQHGLIAETQSQGDDMWWETFERVSNPLLHSSEGKNYTDWRVPTKEELYLLYQQRSLFGIGGGLFWTRTANTGYQPTQNGEYVNMWNGSRGSGTNNSNSYILTVWSVRSF